MKVLEPGKPVKEWSKEFYCQGDGGCGAKLLVQKSDLYIMYEGGYDETTEIACFTCIICQVECRTPKYEVPYEIMKNLPNKSKWMELHDNYYIHFNNIENI